MKTRKEMVEDLKLEYDTDVPTDMKWNDLVKLYSYKVKEGKKVKLSPPDQEEIEKKAMEKELPIREQLLIKIREFIPTLKGKVNATNGEIEYMFQLYNSYYERWDSPTCPTCVARVYEALKKLSSR